MILYTGVVFLLMSCAIVLTFSMYGEVDYVNDKACFDDLMSNGGNAREAGGMCYNEV